MSRLGPAVRRLGAVGVLALAAGACAVEGEDGAARTAEAFASAVAGADGAAACAVLAPATLEELEQSTGQSCAASVLDEAPDAGARQEVSSFGSMAQVRFAEDVYFLARFDAEWRVVAAGCRHQRGGPYSCGIEGR